MGEFDKSTRILMMFSKLSEGKHIQKLMFANEYNVTERTVERDIEFIRNYLDKINSKQLIEYDRNNNSYFMTNSIKENISSVEVVNLLKVLIESRVFREDELNGIVSSLISTSNLTNNKNIKQLVSKEIANYIEPKHKKALMKLQWDLNICINNKNKICLNYYKATGELVNRKVSPIHVVFSDMYFYLLAYLDNSSHMYPAFFRLDRIESFSLLKEKYEENLYARFNIAELKNYIKYMHGGELVNIKIKIRNNMKQVVLDQLPNSTILKEDNEFIVLRTRVFSDGFIKWVLSYGTAIEVIEPLNIRNKLKAELMKIIEMY